LLFSDRALASAALKPALKVECSAATLALKGRGETSVNRAVPWSVGGGVLLVAWATLLVMLPERKNPAFDFIAGNRPVNEDQIQRKLVSDGWTDVRIVLRGRFFLATASKEGQSRTFYVDSLTGRLRGEDDDDDDWFD
jgi:hypothetical protein